MRVRRTTQPQALKVSVCREELFALTGDHARAVLLNQLIYWCERARDFDLFVREEQARRGDPALGDSLLRHGWIEKSADKLNEECMLGVSRQTILRHLSALIARGWVQARETDSKIDRTRQYRVDLLQIQADLSPLGYTLQGYRFTDTETADESDPEPSTAPADPPEFHPGTRVPKWNSEFQNGTGVPEQDRKFQNGTSLEIIEETIKEKQQQHVDDTGTISPEAPLAAGVVVASQASPPGNGQTPEPDTALRPGSPGDASDPALLEALCAAGVTRHKAKAMLLRHPHERIRAQLEALGHRKAHDPAAALVAAIEEDWAPPEAYRKSRQKTEAKAKRAARTEAEAAARQARDAEEAEREASQDALWEALSPAEQAGILAAAREHLRAENTFLALQMDSGKESRAVALELERLRRGLLAERVGERDAS